MLFKSLIWTYFVVSTAIKVPSSWKDEQIFLPYYVVVDGLPSAQNVETYYPESAASDQVVQNDVVVKLFQKMNPHLPIWKPRPLEDPPKLSQKPILIHESLTYDQPGLNQRKIEEKQLDRGEHQDGSEEKQLNGGEHQDGGEEKHQDGGGEEKQQDGGEEKHQDGGEDKLGSNKEEVAENPVQIKKVVDHENPGEIPTRPIYPGEGQWARKELRHRPHITKNVYGDSRESEAPAEGRNFYNAQKQQFQKDFDEFPKKNYEPKRQTKKSEDFDETEFEPYRTYAQVRKTIVKKRLPKKKKTDPRLRESIKDSKIHTVYSEEGYEDSAYDHGDQEKQAERREKGENVDQDEEEFDFPPPPPPASNEDDDESFQKEEEPKSKDGNQSESKSEAVVEFDSQKTQPKQAAIDQEEHLIDTMMDESKYGKKIATQPNKKGRKRRSLDLKYPHYTSEKLNPISSLRYVENPGNSPKGPMSFYKEADKIECPEVTDVDPVPDGVKDGGNQTDSSITTPSPKLDKLGDQIDCFKARYFGEDPLDNPLFKEESAGTPNSSFLNAGSDEENYVDYRSEDPEGREGESLPEAQPYILVKRIYRRPQRKKAKRTKKRPPAAAGFDRHPNLSNAERISEVHYKDEIKPSEQMNVFSDIINNIKNSSRDSGIQPSEIQPVTIRVPQKFSPARKRVRPTTNPPPVIAEIYEDLGEIHRLHPTKPATYYGQNEIPTRRYKKRKRRPILEGSTEIFEVTTEFVKVEKRRVKPVVIDGFKPIIPANADVIQTNHKPEYQEIETATTNKFLVVGMRPPPEIPYVHPSYYLNNQYPNNQHLNNQHLNNNQHPNNQHPNNQHPNSQHSTNQHPKNQHPNNQHPTNQQNKIKFRRRTQTPPTILRKRYVRSAARKGYADIQRDSRSRQATTTTAGPTVETDEDDYIPHRSRNFHYDEKTGKIVYDKKPEQEAGLNQQEEIEYEYVEIEEPTHPTPTKKKEEPRRVWPSKFPDGPNYLDFVKKLKGDPNYVQILDPQPTEKSAETTTTPTPSKIDDGAVPEFLAILTKVKSDENYKVIEDTTRKPKSTTPSPPDEVREDADEGVQNSPGAQSDLIKSADVSEASDSEGGTKSKNYNPRTGVDTSKYTSIQRPLNTRHSISSRYKSDSDHIESEAAELESVPTTITESITINIPTTSIPATTPTSTVKSRRIVANRRRGTTATTEAAPTTQTRRLNRGRNRFRSTTTVAPKEESSRNRRNSSRRSQVNLTVPKNHKEHYTEAQTISAVQDVKPTPRSISLDLLKHSDLSTNKTQTKLDDVEVFKDYDKDKKHGGNYKYKKVQIKITRNYNPSDDANSAGYYDAVPKPFAYYSDDKLPLKINELKEKSADADAVGFDENDRSSSSEENHDYFGESRIKKSNIPAFIKDPSKRLYYYAPL